MAIKKLLDLRSPAGIAVVGFALLAMSPELRQAGRRMAVKGAAVSMGMVDRMKSWAVERRENDGWMDGLGLFSDDGEESPVPEEEKEAEPSGEGLKGKEEKEARDGQENVFTALQAQIHSQLEEIERLRRQLSAFEKKGADS